MVVTPERGQDKQDALGLLAQRLFIEGCPVGRVAKASEAVDRCITSGTPFKIGKSGDPEDRTKTRYVPAEYSRWAVVYTTPTPAVIDQLERDLITKYRTSYPNACDNEIEGGGPDGVSTYVYLAYGLPTRSGHR